MSSKQKITTFLWFDKNAEQAVKFYISIFPDSRTLDVTRHTDAGPGPKGSVLVMSFELAGQRSSRSTEGRTSSSTSRSRSTSRWTRRRSWTATGTSC